MTSRWIAATAAVAWAALGSGCCKETVDSRLFFGRLSPAQCREMMHKSPPPVTLTCPGDEVTLCWAGSTSTVSIDASDDSLGLDGIRPSSGAITFSPTTTTSVKVSASNCAAVTRTVTLVDHPIEAHYDAGWLTNSCTWIGYGLDPAYVSPSINAEYVRPDFKPQILDVANNQVLDCETPPFLAGRQVQRSFNFVLDVPLLNVWFAAPVQASGDWQFAWKAKCPPAYCNLGARFPFGIGLTCRQH